MNFPSVLEFAHQAVAARLQPGDWVIDATVGNGSDTRFLAEQVGAGGLVIGFDIQKEALEKAAAKLTAETGLETNDLAQRVTFLHLGHENLDEGIRQAISRRVLPLEIPEAPKPLFKAVMFNLGYLPGGDQTVITRTDTTLLAIDRALAWLCPGGVLSIAAYPGHPGGEMEAAAVKSFLAGLPRKEFQVIEYGPVNTKNRAPFLLVALRQGEVPQI